jgi:hypothetical protein
MIKLLKAVIKLVKELLLENDKELIQVDIKEGRVLCGLVPLH